MPLGHMLACGGSCGGVAYTPRRPDRRSHGRALPLGRPSVAKTESAAGGYTRRSEAALCRAARAETDCACGAEACVVRPFGRFVRIQARITLGVAVAKVVKRIEAEEKAAADAREKERAENEKRRARVSVDYSRFDAISTDSDESW